MESKKKPSVVLSLVVAIYNVGNYLEKCISSLTGIQSINIEIILVDDGSTDRSGVICDKYSRFDSRVKVIHKLNGGVTSARKAGIKVAKGEYVTFVDGDDWIDSDKYDQMINQLSKGMDVYAFGCIEEYEDTVKVIKNNTSEALYVGQSLDELKNSIIMKDNFFEWMMLPHLADKIIKRSILNEHIFNISDRAIFGEDAACSFTCMLDSSSIYVSDECPYHYRQREGSMVKRRQELDRENFTSIYNILKVAIRGRKNLEQQLKYYMFFLFLLKKYTSINGKMPLFPFKKVQAGDSIYVYGAGGFGQVIYEYLCKSNTNVVVGWTDQRAEMYRRVDARINGFNDLFDKRYDKLVIAILNENIAESIRSSLIKKGIDGAKIDWVKKAVLSEESLPSWLEIDVEQHVF